MNKVKQVSRECNSALSSLNPPGGWESTPALNDLAGEFLLKGREEVLRRGCTAIVDALAEAADTSTRSDRPGALVATHWSGGTGTTAGGRDGRPGQGVVFRGSLAEHAAQLETWAAWDPNEVHATLIARLRATGVSPDEIRSEIKRASPARTLGVSRFGGRAEYEFVERTGPFMDNDGEGPPDALRSALESAGLGYIFQARPDSNRWHLEIPFAEPLRPDGLVYPLHRAPPPDVNEDEVSRWTAQHYGVVSVATEYDDLGERYSREIRAFSAEERRAFEDYMRKLKAWKDSFYTPSMAWLFGILSGVGELACRWVLYGAKGTDGKPMAQRDMANARALPGDRLSISHLGFDAMPAHQLLGLGYPYTRRAATDAVPITQFRDGHLLSMKRVLELTGFVAPVVSEERKMPRFSSVGAPREERDRVRLSVAEFSGLGSTETDTRSRQKTSSEDSALHELDAVGGGLRASNERGGSTRPGLYAAIVDGFRTAHLVQRTLSDKVIVSCPYAGGHSHRDASGTAIMGTGWVKCHHGSCAGREQADFLVALPIDAQVTLVEALPRVLPDDFGALYLPGVLKVAARVRLLKTSAFEEALKRLYREDVVRRPGEQNRVEQWYVRVCGERVV